MIYAGCAGLYNSTLKAVASIPEGVSYRTAVEATATSGLSILQSDATDAEVEMQIGRGQLEELVDAAQNELSLVADMAEWKLWDAGDHTPELIFTEMKREPIPPIFPNTMFSEGFDKFYDNKSGKQLNLQGAHEFGTKDKSGTFKAPEPE